MERAFYFNGEANMAKILLVFPVIALSLALGNLSAEAPQQQDKEKTKLLQAQVDATRQTLEILWNDKEFRNVDTAYQWSRRWLEAERLLKDKKQDHITAAQAHLERMRQLKNLTNQLWEQKLVSRDQPSATNYYVAEAEMWLMQAKQ
jgi:hypothetical protein